MCVNVDLCAACLSALPPPLQKKEHLINAVFSGFGIILTLLYIQTDRPLLAVLKAVTPPPLEGAGSVRKPPRFTASCSDDTGHMTDSYTKTIVGTDTSDFLFCIF